MEIRELLGLSVVLPANESTNASGQLVDEDRVIASVLAGNTSEYRTLVEHYQQPVFRFARNLLGDQHDAEDIAQEVFLNAYDHLASYDAKRASLLTWLLTITRNRCVNYLKQKRTVLRGDALTSQPARSSDESSRCAFWNRLDDALDALPIEQKTAFVLAEIEGLPYADIARIEQTTLGTVKSRIHRAKQRLRTALEPTLKEK